MHFHLPTPLHGWREFAGEVGIIVVGVLIALGAEQAVQGVQARSDERAFEQTIDHEIGLNLFIYDLRSREFACDEKHAGELKSWLDRSRSGKQMPAIWPAAPATLSPYRSAWENRDSQVFNRLPAKRRQKYAEFYDELSNNWSIIQSENDEWGRLIPYAETGPLTLSDRRTIRPIIVKIRAANEILEGNLPISRKIADVLNVKEVQPDDFTPDLLKRINECRSVIASPAETASLNVRG